MKAELQQERNKVSELSKDRSALEKTNATLSSELKTQTEKIKKVRVLI